MEAVRARLSSGDVSPVEAVRWLLDKSSVKEHLFDKETKDRNDNEPVIQESNHLQKKHLISPWVR
jgi:hypothetical protein